MTQGVEAAVLGFQNRAAFLIKLARLLGHASPDPRRNQAPAPDGVMALNPTSSIREREAERTRQRLPAAVNGRNGSSLCENGEAA
jgi:hypothetical protein